MADLLKKYDVPVPRYTSYPTVPYWENTPTPEQWIGHLRRSLEKENSSWSMYLHLPFCETLCTFCGCNTIISKDHAREDPYVSLIHQEWETYLREVPAFLETPIRQLHLGGGTPTYLSEENLEKLLLPILQRFRKDARFEASIEIDPRRTRVSQLQLLKQLGFDRVSLGVQDFDPEVQRLINRVQPWEVTQKITEESRRLGYSSVNFDLIYGLPKQSLRTMEDTIRRTIELRPDRIAFYSFALVPWIKPAQRLFKDSDLPAAEEKRKLYELGRDLFLQSGYVEIGMDHFALPEDSLAQALKERSLHRNFMGYADLRTDVLLGLGVSSISETPYSFHQNQKVLPVYEREVQKGIVPTFRGHTHTEQDQKRREQILHLMTRYEVEFESADQKLDASRFLAEMKEDGLVEIQENTLRISSKGKAFLRNACLFFDERYRHKEPEKQVFSKAI